MGEKDTAQLFCGVEAIPEARGLAYNSAISFLDKAIVDMEHRKYNAAYINFKKFCSTFSVVILALDFIGSTEVSKNLDYLDCYFKAHLLMINETNDARGLRPLLPILKDFRTGWEKAFSLLEKCFEATNGKIEIAVAG